MSPHSLHTLSSSLQALPVTMIFTKQLLLTEKSSGTVAPRSDAESAESYTIRATKLTELLKNIPGYSHGGLNE